MGRKDGVKSAFMRGLRGDLWGLGGPLRGQARLPHLTAFQQDIRGPMWEPGLPAMASVEPTPHSRGALTENFKRKTVPVATVAPLYDNDSQAGMSTATP